MCVDEPLGIGEGQGTPELRFENAEDGGVGSDAESKGENDHKREAGPFAEDAQAVAEVAQKRFDKGQALTIAIGFFGLIEAA
jgi:hypothetical protein